MHGSDSSATPAQWHNRRAPHDPDYRSHAKKTPSDDSSRLSGTQSIERALTLMREIAAHNRTGSRLLDLASRTGLQRPTVHRMLKCLTLENMVQQDPRHAPLLSRPDGVRAGAHRRAALQPARNLPSVDDAHRRSDRRHRVPHAAQRARRGVPRPPGRHFPDQDVHARDRHAPPARRGHRQSRDPLGAVGGRSAARHREPTRRGCPSTASRRRACSRR